MNSPVVIHHAYPYLRLKRATEAIDFYRSVFGAREVLRLAEAGGRIGHAELTLGATTLMLADEHPELAIQGPETLGATTVAIHLHVTHIDALVERAVLAGATVIRSLADQFYGERTGVIRDPFGHEWLLGEQIEDVTHEEMQRRFTELTDK